MKIAVDAMGGDFAPEAIVEGAVQAADEYGVSIVLIGQEDRIHAELTKHDTALLDIKVRHASQIVDMHDEPAFALRRKRDSSLHGAINLVRDGEADAAVSAGNTGAGMAIGTVACRPLEGIDRPALATVMPNIDGETVLLDVGANVDCKPLHLLQFAVMGHVYAKELLKIENPRVGLLSTGEEETKGNSLSKDVFAPLSQTRELNFLGNVEGRDVFNGRADVIVCDGFVGNAVLKASEGAAKTIGLLLKEGFTQSWRTKLGYLCVKPAIEHLRKRIDYTEYGGAPLLGLNNVIIISHGSSKARAIKNAIRVARESVEMELPHKIATMLQACEFDVKSHKRSKSFWRQLRRTIRHEDKERHESKEQEPSEKKESADLAEQVPREEPSLIHGEEHIARDDKSLPHDHERRGWWHLRESKSQNSLHSENGEDLESPEQNHEDDMIAAENGREDEDNREALEGLEKRKENSHKRGLWWHLTHRDHASVSPQTEPEQEIDASVEQTEEAPDNDASVMPQDIPSSHSEETQ
jgi:glycerol-3-phosphate acyltransferase PlsX